MKTRTNKIVQCINKSTQRRLRSYGGEVTPASAMLVSPDGSYQPSHTRKKIGQKIMIQSKQTHKPIIEMNHEKSREP